MNGRIPLPCEFEVPEFVLGLIEEEERFRLTCGAQMKRDWGMADEKVAKVWLDEGKGTLCARFPYQREVIEEFKLSVPKGKKSWNPEDKVWEFSVETLEVVVGILEKFFKVVDLTRETSYLPSKVEAKDTLLSILDTEDKKRIYFLLAKKYHPDTGGDEKKMAEINMIFGVNRG